jgi:hypothetical protein
MNQGLLANAAISLFAHLYFMVPLVIVVILIEKPFIQKATQCSAVKASESCALANAISTFIGIPITWFLSFFLSIPFYDFSSVFDDYFPGFKISTRVFDLVFSFSDISDSPGHVRLFASIFLLIPYYYMSVFIENILIKRYFPDIDSARIKKAVVRMNRVTYLFLGGLMLAVFILGELTDR